MFVQITKICSNYKDDEDDEGEEEDDDDDEFEDLGTKLQESGFF